MLLSHPAALVVSSFLLLVAFSVPGVPAYGDQGTNPRSIESRRADWAEQLQPITPKQWQAQDIRHLFERAGFGATPAELDRWENASPRAVVRHFTRPKRSASDRPFQHSGVFDPGLDPFPASRPATTRLAKETGSALGIDVKPGGNRPIQPVVNQFFYWLRASRLETDRVAYWWAEQMLLSNAPLREKLALFWHCLLYTSPSPRDQRGSRMPSSA